MQQNPYAIQKTGWTGTAVDFSGIVYTTLPVLNPDGSVLTAGTPRDVSLWVFLLTIKAKTSDPDIDAIYEKDWAIAAGLGTSGAWGTKWPASATLVAPPGTFAWEIKVLISGVGDPLLLVKGDLALRQSVGDRIVPNL
jgi:hypothetical protein